MNQPSLFRHTKDMLASSNTEIVSRNLRLKSLKKKKTMSLCSLEALTVVTFTSCMREVDAQLDGPC